MKQVLDILAATRSIQLIRKCELAPLATPKRFKSSSIRHRSATHNYWKFSGNATTRHSATDRGRMSARNTVLQFSFIHHNKKQPQTPQKYSRKKVDGTTNRSPLKSSLPPLTIPPKNSTSSIWKNAGKVTAISNDGAVDFANSCAQSECLRVVCNSIVLTAPEFAAVVAEYAVPVHDG